MRRRILWATVILGAVILGLMAYPRPPKADTTIYHSSSSEQMAELTSYVMENHLSPEDYIISKFAERDIVFIAENHWIKHDVMLIQELIPLMHKAGIYNLGIEFAMFGDSTLIEQLVTSETYNEELANTILFNFMHTWGYKEYADIFRSAWQVNQGLKANEQPFRIVGLGGTSEDVAEAAVQHADIFMGVTILNEFVSKGQKALIYSGTHHAFTHYYQPIVDANGNFIRFVKDRMGNVVYDEIGDRAFTVILHSLWINQAGSGAPRVFPVDGVIDAAFKDLPPEYQRVGFDIPGTPFERLPAESAFYKHGYDDFTLSDFAHGYIYQKPIAKYENVTPIDGFVNKGNIKEARRSFPVPFLRPLSSPAIFNAQVRRMGNIERSYRQYILSK